MTDMFIYFNVIIAVFLLGSGVIGKGPVYKTDNIRDECVEAYKKDTRIFCFIAGALWGVNSVLEFMEGIPAAVMFVMLGICLLSLVLFVVKTRKYMKPNK